MKRQSETIKTKVIQEKRVNSPEETAALAAEFAAQLKPGDTVAFYGNLGSGKTFFVKQLCRYFHTAEEPASPTFTIINEYRAGNDFFIYHFDFYRLEHPAELANLGLEDYFYGGNLCFIEWADKIRDFLPPQRYEIYLDFLADHPQARSIRIFKL
jgi:tRNA threonylcarbamoyladenosine biosynthesis protein TsaE